ncbi:MAG TPA: helix-turn-helix domain-containing protein [Solirubrobacteraceae bacterium]|nr:helix-turn-helix domain-containing protein [Solirubrobacteraceae bacterium]
MTDVLAGRDPDRLLGLLVLDGLVVRRVEAVDRVGVELLGAGDFVRPWDPHSELGSVPARIAWLAVTQTRVALVDDDVQHIVSRFPAVLRNLVGRAARRADALALSLAVAQLPRVDARLLVLFWHLADRFGSVERDGVVVSLPLSHATLAQLVFARRPTVTRALQDLAARGVLSRAPGGRWVLRGNPPASAVDVTGGRRAGALRA